MRWMDETLASCVKQFSFFFTHKNPIFIDFIIRNKIYIIIFDRFKFRNVMLGFDSDVNRMSLLSKINDALHLKTSLIYN